MLWRLVLAILLVCIGEGNAMGVDNAASAWQDAILSVPYDTAPRRPLLELIRQDYEQLEGNRSILKTPLVIGKRRFQHGIGTHAVSHLRIHSPEPIRQFAAWVGVDNNARTQGALGSVVFAVEAAGRAIYRSGVLRGGQEAQRVEVDAGSVMTLDLRVDDGGDGPACDHADWAEAAITTQSGKVYRLEEMEMGAPGQGGRYPFHFLYAGRPSDVLLDHWRQGRQTAQLDPDRARITTTLTDPATGLRVRWEATRYADFPALEWVLTFENAGSADTPLLEEVQSMDLTFHATAADGPFLLHRCNGGIPAPEMYRPEMLPVDEKHPQTLSAGSGRSSTRDFPFFKIEMGHAWAIVAVGWSGNWKAQLECPAPKRLRATAGLERTRFRLHPGERVRSVRILVLYHTGDTLESNAQFRELIYKHYAARRGGKTPEPILFCNTCFTRGGGWLNECNAANQISLIRAYAPLGLEALITDAGWFEGGWPAGAGNWNPRKDAYPQGMGPVAEAAREHGMVYGLWFEPERVVAGTELQKRHPEWLLRSQEAPQETYLLNFGLPEVQDYFFHIVKGFMDLPGFRVYRQDFNMDPLPYWRFNDAPDRQGITEMKYVEGLYAFWDRIAATWPDSLREECASGGHRIDLETVMRMHLHQKSDYWFDDDADLESLWALSQYLPNNVIVAHLNRLDDYSFHATLASSLCLGWIADAPDFDLQRGQQLASRYRAVRRLLTGAWYPLLPYPQSPADWAASQYHRPDLNEGMILLFRRAESPYRTVEVSLHGLEPDATYELTYDGEGAKTRRKGAELMDRFPLTLPERRRSELILYRKASDG